ncbi:MAG: hypothetical protein R2726_13590 [Acidimicrobiales bacterium]
MTKHPLPVAKRRVLQLMIPAAAGLLLVGACSKKEETTTTPSSTAAPTSSTAGGATATTSKPTGTTTGTTPVKNKIDSKVWNSGFTFDLKGWDVADDGGSPAVVIDLDITNNGSANYTPYGPYQLESDGAVLGTGSLKKGGEIVAKSKTSDQLVFPIYDKQFNADETTLTIGSADYQQAKVPLGDPSKATTLQPQALKQTPDPVKLGNVTMTIKVAVVRYDNPDEHSNAPQGKGYLVLGGTAANASATDTYYFDASQVTITRPDGSKSTAKVDSDAIQANTTNGNFALWYELDTPITGTYTLTFTQPWAEGGEPATATATVDLTPGTGTAPQDSSGSSSGGSSSGGGSTTSTAKTSA